MAECGPLSRSDTSDGLRACKDTDANAANGRTYFLYDGGVLLAEMDKDGNLTAVNTWGANGLLSRRVSSTSTYYAYDPQGSVAVRLNSSQTVVTSDLYDAYGTLLAGGASDPYGYCGQWGYYKDGETGKVLCTHRYYDLGAGRWLTRDPIGYLGGTNLYAYVSDRPARTKDPNGTGIADWVDAAQKALGAYQCLRQMRAWQKACLAGLPRAPEQRDYECDVDYMAALIAYNEAHKQAVGACARAAKAMFDACIQLVYAP